MAGSLSGPVDVGGMIARSVPGWCSWLAEEQIDRPCDDAYHTRHATDAFACDTER